MSSVTSPPGGTLKTQDTATQSNYHAVRSTHLHLQWRIDWAAKLVIGSVRHSLLFSETTSKVVLDTSFLEIASVVDDKKRPLSFSSGPQHPVMGAALTIQLTKEMGPGETMEMEIFYSTTADCTALGWLDGGNTSFLYSQCQAIHARSLVPLFDSPAVKITYSASVTSSQQILMSALLQSPAGKVDDVEGCNKEKVYKFDQPISIPSYLIAIAGGDLAFASLSKRCGVWTAPETLEAAVYEFKHDTDRFVQLAEAETSSPYAWGRYDVLVLPPSFPYGGMENPTLTFVTPSLITGDRSNVSTIAHEICHSWFGNLISVASFDHFWLNEGWTTYAERLTSTSSEAERGFEYIIGSKALRSSLEKMPPKFRSLVIDYQVGEDPDDGFSSIPYEKGAQFLLHLERTAGGLEVFSPYIKAYVAEFAGQSITTQQWLAHFWSYWSAYPEIEVKLRSVKWDAWLFSESLQLPDDLKFDTTLADSAYSLASRWDAARADVSSAKFSMDNIAKFSAMQVVYFLETLEGFPTFDKTAIETLDKTYHFNKSDNDEIRVRFYQVALKGGCFAKEAAYWIRFKGRMKYCRPIYSAVYNVDKDLARNTFNEFGRGFLHPIARRLIAKDLGLEV